MAEQGSHVATLPAKLLHDRPLRCLQLGLPEVGVLHILTDCFNFSAVLAMALTRLLNSPLWPAIRFWKPREEQGVQWGLPGGKPRSPDGPDLGPLRQKANAGLADEPLAIEMSGMRTLE